MAKTTPKQNNPSFNVFFLGNSGAGKTSFISAMQGEEFSEIAISTCGMVSGSKDHTLSDNSIATLKIWDTAGQERFKSLSVNHTRHADGIILMYDITSNKTFQQINEWIETIDKSLPIVLVGNKKDLEEKREVSFEEGQKLAMEIGFEFFESSAKTRYNVEEIETCLVGIIMAKKNNSKSRGLSIILNHTKHNDNDNDKDKEKEKQKQNKSCC